MAIEEQSVYYKEIQAEQEAFWKRRRARRIDHDKVPREILEQLEPTWKHWEALPEWIAREQYASDTIRLFLHDEKEGWKAVPHFRWREIGQAILGFRYLKPGHRPGGARPKPQPKQAPWAWMFRVGETEPPAPMVTLSEPRPARVALDDPEHTRPLRITHTVREGESRADIARQHTGRADPALVEEVPRGGLVPGWPVQVRVGRELWAGGSAWHTDSVEFEWAGPTAGRAIVPVAHESWEYAFPAAPGTYTLTVSAGDCRNTRTVHLAPARPRGVAVRVGVFFDGTGNNRENDIPEGTDTNIARLYELYHVNVGKEKTDPVGKANGLNLYTKRIYMNGVGTKPGEENDMLDMATGAGGVTKIEDALTEAAEFLQHFSGQPGPRIIDVFGFSRGAALARDFVNQVNEKLAEQGVEVGFVGLYDTVGSFGLPGNDVDLRSDAPLLAGAAAVAAATNPVLYGLALPRAATLLPNTYRLDLGLSSAAKVVHLVAGNESRANFPLQSLRPGPATPPPGNIEEIAVPGAHADVGGGYGPRPVEEYLRVDDEELTTELYYRTVGPRDQWQAALLEKKAALEAAAAAKGLEAVFLRSRPNAAGEVVDEYALVKRRVVRPGLSNVYLHAMYKKAEATGVPLADLGDMVEKQPTRFAIPDDLRRLFQPDLVTPGSAWYVEAHYAHASAVDWSNRKSLTDWLTNRPDEKRKVFWNEPDKAVIPSRHRRQEARRA